MSVGHSGLKGGGGEAWETKKGNLYKPKRYCLTTLHSHSLLYFHSFLRDMSLSLSFFITLATAYLLCACVRERAREGWSGGGRGAGGDRGIGEKMTGERHS